jgi:MoxR-like ATPase
MFNQFFSSSAAPQHEAFDHIFTLTKEKLNPLLVGPAGCGKTEMAIKIAEKMKLPFYYTGAVQSEFQLKGFTDAQGRPVETPFIKAYRDGGLFLYDEIDGSDPQALVGLHAALENGILDTPAGQVKRNPNFYVIGAANTWGNGGTLDYVGRNHLDAATLDRFVPVPMDYDEQLERDLIERDYPAQKTWPLVVQQARAAARELGLRHVVSTRACVKGAKMLKAGIANGEVVDAVLCKGLPDDTKVKLLEKMKTTMGPDSELARKNLEVKQASAEIIPMAKKLSHILAEVQATHEKGSEALKDGQKQVLQALDLINQLAQLNESLGRIASALRPLQEEANSNLARAAKASNG